MTGTNELQTLFSILGDKTRFTLFNRMLDKCDSCVSELAEDLKISAAGASQQLKIMEKAGILRRVRRGQRICHEINHDNLNVKKIASLMKLASKEEV